MTQEWRLLEPFAYSKGTIWPISDESRDGLIIADVYNKSDARMMAAAPNMAKALKMLLSKSIVELEQGDPWVEVRAALNAAGVEI
jgi:hypothetical protein